MTLSSDGVYKLTVTDASGNTTEVEFSIDKSAPVISGIKDGDITNTIGDITVEDANEVTILLNGEEVSISDIASKVVEGQNTLVVRDSLDNEESITFTYDTTPIAKEWLYTLNQTYHNTDLEDKHYQVIGDNQKLYVELTFTEKFETTPIITVGTSEAINMSCSLTNWETERQYYKCDATITIDGTSQELTNALELPISITNIVDAAGNETTLDNDDITDNGTYGEIVYDNEAPVAQEIGITNITHYIENDDNDAEEELGVANIGDTLRVMVRFDEELFTAPTVTIGGVSKKMHLDTAWEDYYYWADVTITKDMDLSDGEIPFTISGYADAAGNEGTGVSQSEINHSLYDGVVLDTIAPGENDDTPGANWVYILNLSDANNRQTIGNGQTLRVEVKIDEELVSIPRLEIGNTQSIDFKSCKQQSYGYVCVTDIKIDNSVANLVHGEEIPFKITNIVDAAGNETTLDNDDVTYTTSYGQVKFDGEPPKITALGITGFLSEADYDAHYVTDGKGIRILIYANEMLAVEPTVKIGTQTLTATYRLDSSDLENNTYAYYLDIKDVATLGLEEGIIEFTVSGYKDIFGNEGKELTNADITYSEGSYNEVIYDPEVKDVEFSSEGGSRVDNKFDIEVTVHEDNVAEITYLFTTSGNSENIKKYAFSQSGVKVDNLVDGKFTATLENKSSGKYTLWVKVVDKAGNVDYFKTENKFVLDSEVSVTGLKINSNNANPSLAKARDWVGVYLTVSEPLAQNPTFTVNGQVMDRVVVTPWGDNYTYEVGFTVTEGMNGRVEFTIEDIIDAYGNTISLSNNDSEYSVTIDTNKPVYKSLGIYGEELSDGTWYVKEGSKIYINTQFNEKLAVAPSVKINGEYAFTYGDPVETETAEGEKYYIYSKVYTVSENDAEGFMTFEIYGYEDEAGNIGESLNASNTDVGAQNGNIIVDKTAPKFSNVPKNGSTVNYNINPKVSDNNAIETVTAYLNDVEIPNYYANGMESLHQAGTYKLVAVDKAGNETVTTFIIDFNAILIDSDDDLAKAIENQADNQYWVIKEGEYSLLPGNKYINEGSQAGWFFPITANNLKIVGEGKVTIKAGTVVDNGSWATQNFVTIWGDNVKISNVTLIEQDGLNNPNKSIEIIGNNAVLTDIVVYPNTNEPDFSGSIYIGAAGITTTLNNVTLNQGRISLSGATDANNRNTLNLNNVTINYAGSIRESVEYLPIKNSEYADINANSLTVTISNTLDSAIDTVIANLPDGTKLIKGDGSTIVVGDESAAIIEETALNVSENNELKASSLSVENKYDINNCETWQESLLNDRILL